MRKIVVSEFLSLDGVMESPDQWHFQFWHEEMGKYKFDELFASDALLLGRVTYQGFAAAWPSRSDESVIADIAEGGGSAKVSEVDGFADRMNNLPKYVVSTSLEKVEWSNSTLIKENVAEEIIKLKQQPGQNILVAGSANLIRTLMQHDLIDEYHLMIHPVVVGRGKHLFQDESVTQVLKLVETKTFGSGVIVLIYHSTNKETQK